MKPTYECVSGLYLYLSRNWDFGDSAMWLIYSLNCYVSWPNGYSLFVHLHISPSLLVQMVNNLPAMQETWCGKISRRMEWLPTLFLLGEFQGQRSLTGPSIGSQRV